MEHLPKADRGSQSTLLREATLLCSSYPVLFTDKVLAGVRQRHHTRYHALSLPFILLSQWSFMIKISVIII